MKQNNQLKAALILLENVFFNIKKYNRKEFIEILANDELSHSEAGISRLLTFIDEIFGIPLTFKTKNGRIEVVEDLENRFHLIRSLYLIGRLKKEKQITKNIVQFSSDSSYKNIELIPECLDAISKSFQLKLVYQKYYTDKPESHILNPIFLKEYLGRWYLLAEKENGKIIVFGIDRIVSLEILNKRFDPSTKYHDLYKHTIGVNFSGEHHYSGKPQKILLRILDYYQLRLFEDYPIHPSQRIFEKNNEGGIIEIEVVINYELKQLLASYLEKVVVIEPTDLKEEMAGVFARMKLNYKK